MSRPGGVPVAVAAVAALFLLFGALVALPAALSLLSGRGEGSTLIPLLLVIGVGLAAFSIGIGIMRGRRWARILGLVGAVLGVLAAMAMLFFVTVMSLGMGIAFSDRLFLEPSAYLVLILVLASYCIATLARHGAWFRAANTPGHHARLTDQGE